TRVISPALRRALELRDQGCAHPGCRMPARFCDAHHITHWAQGGQTTLANLRLLCRHHHRQAHHHQPYPRKE
ncbi:MAG: HNH endonuclease, partial [Actinobacteria bacterium]|nr:HNH endonuclease [Actinomycetota bacterium]